MDKKKISTFSYVSNYTIHFFYWLPPKNAKDYGYVQVANRPFHSCSVTWPLNSSEAGGDLVLIKTLCCCHADQVVLMLTSWH